MSLKKIVLFGGSFDPIHLGHTEVAEAAFGQLQADRMIFIPAKRSPLKKFLPKAGDDDRLAMVELGIRGNGQFECSDFEIHKSAPSYTLHTVRHFRQIYGNDSELYWLAGADNLPDLQHWYKIEQILDACNLSVMLRGGVDEPDFDMLVDRFGSHRIAKLKKNMVKTPLLRISSTEIRKRLANGEDVSDMLDPAVLSYIEERNLYR